MLDIKLIRENPADIKQRLADKGADCGSRIDRILEMDQIRRDLIFKTEGLKAEQNKVSKQIPAMKKAGEDTAVVFAKMKELSETVKQNDAALREAEEEYQALLFGLPNLPDRDLKPGEKKITSRCASSERRTSLILRPKTTWTCART
jgi:seryl-tRNA synthetase